MTYDERQEIEEWLTIIEKNTQRLERNIDTLKKIIEEHKCEIPQNKSDK